MIINITSTKLYNDITFNINNTDFNNLLKNKSYSDNEYYNFIK